MAKLHKATIRVDFDTKPGTDYRVFIDGLERESRWTSYEFEKDNDGYGFKNIRIEVLSGAILIPESAAEAEYPTINEKPVYLHQKRYCEWMFSSEYKHDVWYDGVVEYKHLWPQGPSYYKEVDGKTGRPVYEYDKIFDLYGSKKKETSQYLRELLFGTQ